MGNTLKATLESVYYGTRSFLDGATAHVAVSWGGRVTLVALSCFILYANNIFTASTLRGSQCKLSLY